jgi:hypothetical protein
MMHDPAAIRTAILRGAVIEEAVHLSLLERRVE